MGTRLSRVAHARTCVRETPASNYSSLWTVVISWAGKRATKRTHPVARKENNNATTACTAVDLPRGSKAVKG